MNTCRFNRYVEQFGFECIERNHKERLTQFIQLWAVVFAVFGAFTVMAIATDSYISGCVLVDSAILTLFSLSTWQRYQLHKKLQRHKAEICKSPA